jgi:adenylate cyclase
VTQERAKRKLAAILSADVKGYSRLMGEDELATVETLKKYREVISSLVGRYSGRVVDSPGDNVLAEFGSVVDAVESAVEIQKELKAKNEELAENRRMEFRIGVNLGDVIDDEGRIYGDGVNVASRVEGLAEGGGICVSGIAFDGVRNKLNLGYEYLGEHAVKNIAEPIRVYRVLMGAEVAGRIIGEKRARRWRWAAIAAALIVVVGGLAIWGFYFRTSPLEVASVERMAFSLPDQPSIAVLPFKNLSGDREQEYLADGITENIITALSKTPKMFVIASNSVFTYKGKPVKVQQVAEEMGVRYVLEGSVQKSGDRLRINAQLIDALKGNHLWAERYDRDLKDIFAVQDETTKEIITALQVKLTEGEQARIYARGTDNLEAYLKFLKGREYDYQFNAQANAMARKMFTEALSLDPNYAIAYRFLAGTHFMDIAFGSSKSPKESMGKAIELTKKAIIHNEFAAGAHGLLGFLYTMTRQYDKGIAEAQTAVALDPNDADAHTFLTITLVFAGRYQEAIQFIEKALRLNPLPPGWYWRFEALAYQGVGRYDEAISAVKKNLKSAPNDINARTVLAATYGLSGREEEARSEVAKILRINPKYSLQSWVRIAAYKNKSDLERLIKVLRNAGLPDKPPLPLPDKPSIAVLPFVNMSGDPEQEYFSDGITEEIITALSKTPKLFVIARTSSFKYKGKEVDVRTVGRELGVRYVLEGSVRKGGDKVRITAQLVDAKTGSHLWAERYDRELKDIFATQDEITMKILTSLQVSLTEGEMTRMYAKGTNDLDAYLLFLQGWKEAGSMNKDGNFLGRQLAEKTIALDPKFAMAYNLLATTYMNEVILGLSEDPRVSLQKAMELTQKAIALDNSLSWPHALLGFLYTLTRQHDKGIAECEQAVNLEPNSAISYFYLSLALKYAGRPREAITMAKEAMRLNPIPPGFYYQNLTHLYCLTGQYEEAIKAGKEATRVAPNNFTVRAFLTVAYSLYGRQEEARIEAAEVLRINPKFLVDSWAKTMPFRNEADKEMTIGALRKAGLK